MAASSAGLAGAIGSGGGLGGGRRGPLRLDDMGDGAKTVVALARETRA
jgi:hypothetical protein